MKAIVNLILYLYICIMKTEIDIEMEKLEEKMKNIPKVTRRYFRMRFKRRVRKLTGINLR